MSGWNGWPFNRVYLLLVAVAFLVVGGQVLLFHLRAAFRSKAMWGPVVMAPIIAAAGVAAAVVRNDVVGWAAFAIFAVGFVDGHRPRHAPAGHHSTHRRVHAAEPHRRPAAAAAPCVRRPRTHLSQRVAQLLRCGVGLSHRRPTRLRSRSDSGPLG